MRMDGATHVAQYDGNEAHASDGTHCPGPVHPVVPAMGKDWHPAFRDQSLHEHEHRESEWHELEG